MTDPKCPDCPALRGGWRELSKNIPRGEQCPQTLESAQAAWERDQEVILEQREEISRLKRKINDLRQSMIRAEARGLVMDHMNEVYLGHVDAGNYKPPAARVTLSGLSRDAIERAFTGGMRKPELALALTEFRLSKAEFSKLVAPMLGTESTAGKKVTDHKRQSKKTKNTGPKGRW